MHLRKDDQVVVISGNDKGTRGKVLRVIPKTDKVLVEGVNVRVKHLRKTQASPQGGRIEREQAIPASKVLLWSEKAGKGVRTRSEFDSKGQKVRVGVPCGTKFV
ncbi:MAG TPA: 50S ribosomal protein L24 [Planctomycetota bacterium]